MTRSGPSSQSTVILMGLVVIGTAALAVTAVDLTDPIRDPPPEAQFAFEPTATGTPTPVDPERDVVLTEYVAGERIDARDVRVTVTVADRRVVLDGADARSHEITAGERLTVRFVDDRVVARWGVESDPPTWTRELDRPVDVRAGDRVRLAITNRESGLPVAELETTA